MKSGLVCFSIMIALLNSPSVSVADTLKSKNTPGITFHLLNSSALIAGQKVMLKWSIKGAPPDSRVAIFGGKFGKFILSEIDPALGQTTFTVPATAFCGDVGSEITEVAVVLYADPDKAIMGWCTVDLPNAAPATKNIKIYAFEAIQVQQPSARPTN